MRLFYNIFLLLANLPISYHIFDQFTMRYFGSGVSQTYNLMILSIFFMAQALCGFVSETSDRLKMNSTPFQLLQVILPFLTIFVGIAQIVISEVLYTRYFFVGLPIYDLLIGMMAFVNLIQLKIAFCNLLR